MASKKPIYAPIPVRAVADEALTALDLRVLAAIAAHDRFGVNGIGCYAAHPLLATKVRCHLKSLSRAFRALAEAGYIETGQHPLNKRLRVYRVVYSDADLAVMKMRIGDDAVTDKADPDLDIGNETAASRELTGNRDFQEPEHSQGDAEVNIFREAGIDSAKPKDNSVETASPSGDAHFETKNVAAYLRKLKAALTSTNGRAFTKGETDYFYYHADPSEIPLKTDIQLPACPIVGDASLNRRLAVAQRASGSRQFWTLRPSNFG